MDGEESEVGENEEEEEEGEDGKEVSDGCEAESNGESGELKVEFIRDENEIFQIVSSIMGLFIEMVIPETPRVLTLKKAGKCLRVLGKIWNLSEYPPVNYVDDMLSSDPDEKLMDMEGYVDDYQYLHIEAVDLALTDIRVIPINFIWLLSADLSGNRLTNSLACPITKLPNIIALKLNRNRFEDPYLPPMKHLQYLGLNSNKITSLHKIYHPNLETLDLNYNLISELDPGDCWKHTKLMQLELRGNQLKTTSGIEYASLTVLYLAQNQITELNGLEFLVNLQRLHLRDNPLSDLTGFTESNINLVYLNVRNCEIEKVTEVKKLTVLKGLKTLVIMGNIFNPEKEQRKQREKDEYEEEDGEEELEEEEEEEVMGEADEEEIRIEILAYLPNLSRLDKKLVTRDELEMARDSLRREESS